MSTPQEIREEAVARIKAKRNFWRTFGTFVIVWIILIGVWALSGGGYFWPAWAIFGMVIGLAFSGYNAYTNHKSISQSQIDEEIRKLQQ